MSWRYTPVRQFAPPTNQQFQQLAAELGKQGAVIYGNGSPEGRYEGQQGDLYQQRDPEGPGVLWVKMTPSGDTGWTQIF